MGRGGTGRKRAGESLAWRVAEGCCSADGPVSRFALPLPPSPALVSLPITCISQAERVEGLSLRTGGQDGNVPLGRGSHKLVGPVVDGVFVSHPPLSPQFIR